MTLEQMLEIAKRGGSVRWPDGATTRLTMEDSHLFGMVIACHRPSGEVEPLSVQDFYDADPAPSGTPEEKP